METNSLFNFRGVTGFITKRLTGGLLQAYIRAHFGAWGCNWGENRQQPPDIHRSMWNLDSHSAHHENCSLFKPCTLEFMYQHIVGYVSTKPHVVTSPEENSPVRVLNRAGPETRSYLHLKRYTENSCGPHHICLLFSSTMQMETVRASEKSVNFCPTPWLQSSEFFV